MRSLLFEHSFGYKQSIEDFVANKQFAIPKMKIQEEKIVYNEMELVFRDFTVIRVHTIEIPRQYELGDMEGSAMMTEGDMDMDPDMEDAGNEIINYHALVSFYKDTRHGEDKKSMYFAKITIFEMNLEVANYIDVSDIAHNRSDNN